MGYSEWGYNIDTVSNEIIKKHAPNEYKKLGELIGGSWLTLAKSIESCEEDATETYMSMLLSDLGDYNDNSSMFNKIHAALNELKNKVFEQTKMSVTLFASVADLGRCDISDDDYFFVLQNKTVINPDISVNMLNQIVIKNVVQGG